MRKYANLGLPVLWCLFLLAPIATVASVSTSLHSSIDLPYNVGTLKALPAAPIDVPMQDQNEATSGWLPEVTPFWVDLVNAELVSNDGEGVYIAVLDTGLLSMWEYFFSQANIADYYGIGFTHDIYWDPSVGDFVVGPLHTRSFITDGFEGSGHGTHVVSTIVGYRYGNYWIRGVAPKATIIPVLVLDAWQVPYPGGTAYFTGAFNDMVAAGIYYIANLAEELDGPVIISMSLGGPNPSPIIEDAINYAISKGLIIVVAAGNAGYAGMSWPGAYPQVISCGMVGWTEQFVESSWWVNDVPENHFTTDYWGNNHILYLDIISSRPNKTLGQKPFHLDVVTPGTAIVGPYKPYFSYNVAYYYVWGTSMATPHVSGIAALYQQSHPDVSQETLEWILKHAARGFPLPCDGSWAWDLRLGFYHFEWYGTDYGAGFLQADEVLNVKSPHN
ncbi:MAG: S8 family serine peptidase [Candidatus Korarchaeota archaeon]|nr:S8 family serine peptidase [Candidatus Korarchaeota archaeon]NIU85364.1 S8 family serine peptidase [Candidatus Thorarchaeota archaeon]NIW15462.1 S8 family serine peptidase [Candidatus Thorarchaeota archaeon]NIW53406.1 S8 family serine peptidase [Candidatus Korarchaeota archaeon]